MVIVIEDDGPAIRDPLDFGRFSVRAVKGRSLRDGPQMAFEGESVAWVSQGALRAWPELKDLPAWQDGLAKMLAYAAGKGWIDEARCAVRAHIEWVDET